MPDTLVAAPPRGREPLAYPAGGVDGLLRRAARRWPGRTAIRTTSGAPDRAGTAGAPDRAGTCGQPAPGWVGTAAVTFATLDAWADRCAWAVRGLVGTGAVCGLATVLDPEFAAAFHGVCRSGNAVVSLNPLHPPAVLARALRTAGARVAFVTADMYAKLAGLEGPPLVVIGPAPDGVPKLWELADAATPAALPEPDGDDLACIHFTSGTTGEPKGVRLSHRNLVVNAMQTAQAHGLDDHSVVLNHLPAYHLMHLGAALHAGAAQVLCTVADPLDSLHAARRVRAT